MGEIIRVDFTKEQDDGSGYFVAQSGDCVGVYNGVIAASLGDEGVYVGEKHKEGVINPVFTTLSEMNRFCIMWLCIFNPSVIKG